MALLQIYEPFKIGFLITYLGPIVVVLSLSLLKEIWDDIKRGLKDARFNNELYTKIAFDEEKFVRSKNIRVGDILLLKKN